MNIIKKECPICKKLIRPNNYERHLNACGKLIKKTYNGVCPYCGQVVEGNNGVRRNHYRWCTLNPKRNSYKVCNNILLKEAIKKRVAHTDYEIVGEKIKLAHKEGKYDKAMAQQKQFPSFKGKHHSEKTKEILREKALANPFQRKCKSTVYYKGFRFDSTWEIKLAKILDSNNIKWSKPKPLEWVDKDNKIHHYFADFYLDDYNVYLDPKNEYCFKVQKIKIDILLKNYTNILFLHEKEINIDFIKSKLSS